MSVQVLLPPPRRLNRDASRLRNKPVKGKEDDMRAIFRNEKENDKNKQNEKENLLETGKESTNKTLEKRLNRDTSRLRNKPTKGKEDDKRALYRNGKENDKNKQNDEEDLLKTGKETFQKRNSIKLDEEVKNDSTKMKKDMIRNTKNVEIMKKQTRLKMKDGLDQNKSETDLSIDKRLKRGKDCENIVDMESVCCHHCDQNLAGDRYVIKDDHPYCTKCYDVIFANICMKCNTVISIDSKDLSYKDQHWHGSCFLCISCKTSLVDTKFVRMSGQLYCGSCHENQFGPRCVECGDVLRTGMKRMEYKGRQWHEDCFICSSCKKNIGDNSFFPSGSDIHCSSCYEESFSVKCTGCSKAIISGGITYRGQPWHRQCFTCTHCNQSLAGLSFTTRDDKQYCTHCVTQLFSRPCSTCSEPVGTGGTRFVSFEGRHWHSSCFTCTSCFSSLVDKGFIAEEKEILCIDCARKKMEEESFEYE